MVLSQSTTLYILTLLTSMAEALPVDVASAIPHLVVRKARSRGRRSFGTGPIVGLVIGLIVILILLIYLAYLIRDSQKRKRARKEAEEEKYRNAPAAGANAAGATA